MRLLRATVGVVKRPQSPHFANGEPGKPPSSSRPQPQPMAMPDHGVWLMLLCAMVVPAANIWKMPAVS